MMKTKKFFLMLTMLCMAFTNGSCSDKNDSKRAETETTENSKSVVVYFSMTGNTEAVAKTIASATGSDMWRIEPLEPYTSADLNYYNNTSRTTKEQNDDTSRPALKQQMTDIADYDVLFLGYPIWWGIAPRVVYTFVESHNLEGKIIIPFCTSGGSGIGESDKRLQDLAPKADWKDGRRLSSSITEQEIKQWTETIDMTVKNQTSKNKMEIKVNGRTLTASMADNSSATALLQLLAEGDRTIAMHDYGNFEKVGSLGTTLPTNNEQITTQTGDLILYQGNQFVIYYDTNSWNFTRLGRIDNVSQSELKSLLGTGDVTVTLSLPFSTAINATSADKGVATATQVYTLDGRKCAEWQGEKTLAAMPRGQYLVRKTFADGSIRAEKLIRN